MQVSEKKRAHGESSEFQCQNALVIRIALFLNYLSKKNYNALINNIQQLDISSEGELLKFMISKQYINPKHVSGLKKTCLSFARAQEDTRFGSLCLEFGFLTQSNLNLALEEQKDLSEGGRTVFLGDLLVEAGMLSDRQQKLILKKQKLDHEFKESIPGLQEKTKEIREKDVVILISEDGLTAFMIKTEEFDPNLTLFDLKEIFDDNGIIFGLVDDNALENFIKSGNTQTRFELAKGLPPVQGTDARIFYLFDQNYLSAGLLGKDGSMDFKDRGEIPSVLKGDVLAEKIPCISGRDGINVFGDTVTADPPRDMDILCGDGVGFSQDKLTAHALIDGYPMLNRDGVITVTDAHVIRGDVDYNTGHVKFDKSVFITGTIKSGFRVEAKDVVVRSVDGGTIISQGDVSVANGITDATIRTRGGISAGFVHRSRLSCMGDMDIEKEVVESTLVLEGTFEMSQGKLFASSVSARGGAKIYHVGSIKTLPSTIAVGISPYMQKEMNFLNRQIEKNQGNYDNQSREKINLENQLAEIEQKLARLNTAGKNKEQPLLDPERHNQKIAEFRRKKNRLERETAKAEKELTILSETVKHWISEKFNLQRQSYASPPKPILDVKGRIFTDTKVKGIHSSTVITQDLTRVRLIEMSCANETDDRRKAWEMITTRL